MAIQLNSFLPEITHEGTVRRSIIAGSSIDTGNPESTKGISSLLTVIIGILASMEIRFMSNSVQFALGHAIPLCLLENLFVSSACNFAALNPHVTQLSI